MIDKEDFPVRTPQDHLDELRRIGQKCKDWASFEEEGRKIGERIKWLFHKYIVARKNLDLKVMSLDALLERFEEICLVEDETHYDTGKGGIEKYNACQDALWAVHEELIARGPDARRALMRFYNHFNHQVRLKAATLSYRVAPGPARRCLEALQNQKSLYQALDAGMTLRAIDNGTAMLD